MELIAIKAGKELSVSFLKYLFDQIKDILPKKISSFKYKGVLNDEVIEKEFLFLIQEIIESKDDYENEPIFKKFKDDSIKSIIKEIFVQEKIDEKIKERIKTEMKDFQINDDNILNVLLIDKESNEIKRFKDTLNKLFNIDKNGFINIDFKDSFNKMKKIKFTHEPNDKYDLIWAFDKENQDVFGNLDKNKNIPIIYLHINSFPSEKKHSVNNYDKKYIKYYNNHFIDIDNNQTYLNLFEKSLINILINDNKTKEEKKSKEISDLILPRIKFESGNEINKITTLNNSLIQSIFKKFIFEGKLSPFVKGKCVELLSLYQKHIESRKKAYFSSFITKCSNELVIKLRNIINERNLKSRNMNNKKDEKIEVYDNIYNKLILFINEMNNDNNKKYLNKSQNVGIKTSYVDNLSKELERMFEDYCLHKASTFINLLVIKCLKEMIIDYYGTLIIQYYYDIHKDDYILED